MSEESRFVIKFNDTMANLFLDMKSIKKKYGLKRINTVILLQSLLEEKDSIFYDYLCATLAGQNPYKKIIQDCSRELNRLKKMKRILTIPKNISPLKFQMKSQLKPI